MHRNYNFQRDAAENQANALYYLADAINNIGDGLTALAEAIVSENIRSEIVGPILDLFPPIELQRAPFGEDGPAGNVGPGHPKELSCRYCQTECNELCVLISRLRILDRGRI